MIPTRTASRRYWNHFGRLVCLAALSGVIWTSTSIATENEIEIPLKRVVLFNAGVGFFEHAGTVTDSGSAAFKFNVDDINDLLKSLVVQDADGGRVSTVGYASKDPVEKTLKSFAIDLTSNPSLADLLSQVRGEQVVIEEGADKKTGLIVGLEKREIPAGDEQVVNVDVMTLLTEDGLTSVRLDAVGKIRLENAKLDAEFRKALAIVASANATDKKGVTVNFLGQGERRVKVGYIQETPIWKTTYRLVLSDEEKPFLQGWAIVENTTENDWKDVELSLVSGRPISFVMNLYEPIYVPRPVIAPELYASLGPQVYDQDMGENELLFRGLARRKSEPAADAPAATRGRGMMGRGSGMGAAPAAAPAPEIAKRDAVAAGAMGLGEEAEGGGFDFREGVEAMAQASDVGELFQYAIDTPVSLPRQESAMLPIVNAEIEAEKVSIYNPSVQAKHPLAGLKLTNSTDLHLMQGPITVFDAGTFAGDAKIDALPPKASRLISYALDLDTEVAVKSDQKPSSLVSVRLEHGTLQVENKLEKSLTYTVKNSGKKAKNVLIEKPIEPGWKLVAPEKADEETRKEYRFRVAVEPGVPKELTVKEEQIQRQTVALSNLNDPTIEIYLSAKVVPEEVKAVLQAIVKVKGEISELSRRRAELEKQIAEISQDQARIRDNMGRLERGTELYNRYVKKFGEQEDQVETLRTEIKKLQDQEEAKRQELEKILREA